MDKQEILRRLMQQKLQLNSAPVENKEFVPVTSRPTAPTPDPTQDIQMQDVPVTDQPVQMMGGDAPSDLGQLTQIDQDEARRQALERLKQRGTQKLNFRGGVLDQNGVYDNN